MRGKRLIILSIILCFMLSIVSSGVAGESTESNNMNSDLMMFDMVLARPAGLISIGVGTTLFVLSLPFTLCSRNVKHTAHKLIMEPINYTFTRPLGQMEWQ